MFRPTTKDGYSPDRQIPALRRVSGRGYIMNLKTRLVLMS